MSLYKPKNCALWWCSFYIGGKRQRHPTGMKKEAEARKMESILIARAERSSSPLRGKSPVLRELALDFVAFVSKSQLAPKTQKYYRAGWKLLANEPISGMRIDQIRSADAATLHFGSPAWTNTALRTLRRMLFFAHERDQLGEVPRIKCRKHPRRERIIDPHEEVAILARSSPLLGDVLVTMLDAGPRPGEVLVFTWENIRWLEQTIFIASGKTANSRRFIPMSDRMRARYLTRWAEAGKPEKGFVFPSARSERGHVMISSLQHEFQRIREMLTLGSDMVLYCARHTFGTNALEATGNLAAVMKVMGHSDAKTAMTYQHPGLEGIRESSNRRNERVM